MEHVIDPQLPPFDIAEGVRIENTDGLIDCPLPTKNAASIGTFSINGVKNVRCALVYRYDASPSYGVRKPDTISTSFCEIGMPRI